MAGKNQAELVFKANTSQFNNGIKQMNATLTKLRSELKLNATQAKASGTSVDSLKSRQSLLKTELGAAREKTTLLNAKLQEAEKCYGKNSTEVQKLTNEVTKAKTVEAAIQAELNATNTALKEQEKASGSLADTVSKADDKIEKLSKELQLNATQLAGASDKTELLKERQKLLAEMSQTSSTKVQALEQALQQCGEEVGKNSDEYRQLESALVEAKTEQASIQNEIKATNNELKEQKTQLQKVAESFQQLGEKMKSIGSGLQTAGSKLTNCITTPALAAGGALVSMAGWGGFKRLTDIDTAQKKLEALGYTAEDVETVTENVSEAVDGTAYSLADGMTIAVTSMAAGVKKGKELEQYLKNIGNTAALTGTGLGEVGDVFNKVQAKGKTSMQELNQLMGRGVPIVAWLGDTFHKTQEEILDMCSKGQLSSDMFFEAVQKNTDGMAVAMGDTIGGKMGNLKSAISRVGAAFLGAGEDGTSAFNGFKGVLDRVLEGTRDLIPVAKKVGELFSEVFGAIGEYVSTGGESFGELSDSAQRVFDKIRPIIDVVRNLADKFMSLSPQMKVALAGGALAAGPLLTMLGKVTSGIGTVFTVGGKLVGMFAGVGAAGAEAGGAAAAGMALPILPILGTVAAVTAVIGIIALLWVKCEDFRNFFTGMWEGFKEVISGFLEKINFGDKIDAIKEKFSGLGEKLTKLGDLFKVIGTVVSALLVPVIGVLAGLFNALLSAIEPLLDIIGSIIDVLAGLGSMIVGIFTGDMDKAKDGAKTFIEGIGGIFSGLWNLVKGILGGFVSGIFNFFASLLEKCGVIQFIGGVVDKFRGFVNSVGEVVGGIVDKISAIFQTVWNVIQVAVMMIGEIFSAAWSIIATPFMFIWENCKEVVIAVWNAIKSKVTVAINAVKNVITTVFGAVFSTVKSVWERIKSAISAVVNTIKALISAGFNLIKTYIINPVTSAYNAVKSKFDAVKSAISGAVSNVKSTVLSGFNIVKTSIINPISDAYASVISKFDAIKNGISEKISAAKEVVGNAIERIKGFFNFNWSLPHLKMPHFKISGSFSLSPPSVPSFGIDWYAKGGILTKPTIFGQMTNGRLLGGGEAGHEAILPISNLRGYVEDALDNFFGNMTSASTEFDYDKLAKAIAKQPIYLQMRERELGRAVREVPR